MIDPICNACGFNNPAGMRFCGNCGTRLGEISDSDNKPNCLSEIIPDGIGVMMGPDLIDRFRRAGLEASGQRRNVTILFADLSDYTTLAGHIDSEDLYHIVQRFIRTIIDVVYKYEGTVDKIIGDGVMALFGAPIAHENNAERAVRAALDMQVAVSHLSDELEDILDVDLKLHIGLHAGSVIVGGLGSNMMMDYTAIGDTVNLANRLEEAAPSGTILVSGSVFQRTSMLFEYRNGSEYSLKGFKEPVKGYRLLGLKKQPGRVRGLKGLSAPLIGRDNELDPLLESVNDLIKHQRGRFILITGEAGIGKSRLTSEFKTCIDKYPVKVLEGQSLTYRSSVSYWIFLELLRDYFQISLQSSKAQSQRQLLKKTHDLFGHNATGIIPYLEHLLSIEHTDISAAERIAYLDASQLRQQIFLAVRDLLVAESQKQPLVLILEDLHWADDASLDLLSFLSESLQTAPLMVYAISRPIEEGKLSEIAVQTKEQINERFIRVDLQGLNQQQSERLINELLTLPEIPADFRNAVLGRADGVPFFLEEILRMLIDDQLIFSDNDRWHITSNVDLGAIGVPENLQGLILARFDRLDQITRKSLQIASVIGQQFSVPVLAEVLGLNDEDILNEALSQLVEKAFIIPHPGSMGMEYQFRHVLTSDAVYSTLLRNTRNELHGNVGEAIESHYAPDMDSHIEVLAGHFRRSANKQKAFYYLLLAGHKASRDYVHDQARKHYEHALRLLSEVEHSLHQAVEVYSGLGDVLTFIGEYSPAREYYQSILSSLEGTSDEKNALELCKLYRKIGTTFERQGDFDQALAHLNKAIQVLEGMSNPAPVEEASVYNDIGWVQFLQGNFEEAHKFILLALRFVEGLKQYDVIASVHNRLGAVAYNMREYERAASHVRKSLVLRETIGDSAGVARLYNNLGLLGLICGDLRDAEMNFTQAIELLERIGDAEGIALAYTNLGLVQFDRGNHISSERNIKVSLFAAERIGHQLYRGRALMYLGRLKTAQCKYDQSEKLLLQSLGILESLGAQDNQIDAAYYLGENCLAKGDLEDAKRWVSRTVELIEDTYEDEEASSVQRGKDLRLLGAIAREKGNTKKSRKLLTESADIFNASSERLETAKTALQLGYLAYRESNYLEARQHFQEARMLFSQLGADLQLRRAEKAIAKLGDSVSPGLFNSYKYRDTRPLV